MKEDSLVKNKDSTPKRATPKRMRGQKKKPRMEGDKLRLKRFMVSKGFSSRFWQNGQGE
jgi:hypothetical protein